MAGPGNTNFDDIIRQVLGMSGGGVVKPVGEIIPLDLNDPANFAQPERMPNSSVQKWTDQDWANNLFIKPANDPGRRQRPNT